MNWSLDKLQYHLDKKELLWRIPLGLAIMFDYLVCLLCFWQKHYLLGNCLLILVLFLAKPASYSKLKRYLKAKHFKTTGNSITNIIKPSQRVNEISFYDNGIILKYAKFEQFIDKKHVKIWFDQQKIIINSPELSKFNDNTQMSLEIPLLKRKLIEARYTAEN